MEEILKILLLPSNLITWLFFISLALYLFKFTTHSINSYLLAITLYFFLGCGPVSQYLLSKLEYQYPPYDITADNSSEPSTIILLTGSGDLKPKTPLSAQINSSSTYRLVEASHIFNNSPPGSRIIISGTFMVSNLIKNNLKKTGVPEGSIHIDKHAGTTYLSANNLSKMDINKDIVLITSAGHMPRAIAVFKSFGFTPVPAPTDFLTKQNIFSATYLPSPQHLSNTDLAIHEYIAIIWYKLTDKIVDN